MNALKWWISLAIVLCIALPASLAFAQAAGLAAVGAPDPAHGFPKWYLDKNGLQLAPCLDAGAADPCGLIAAAALPNPALPVVFPTNFPNEVFYNRATSRIDGIGGGAFRADLGIALEGAFGGATGTVADGAAAEVVFARLRIRVNGGLVPGASYTATYPFGSRKAALVVGEIDRARRGRQSLQRDGQDLRPRIDDDEPGHGSEPVGWRTAADPDGDREPRGSGHRGTDGHHRLQRRRRHDRDGAAGQRSRDAHDLDAVPRRAFAHGGLQRQP